MTQATGAHAARRVLATVDAVVVLERPLPELVHAALQIPFPLVDPGLVFDRYEGAFADGPFATATLKFVKEHRSGALILTARGDVPVEETELDLGHFGYVRSPTIDPQPPPEGALSYAFDFSEDVLRLVVALGARSRLLRQVVLSWGPLPTGSAERSRLRHLRRFGDERFSVGIERTSGTAFLAIPVSNRRVDYLEYYEIPLEWARRPDDHLAELRLVAGQARRREIDDRLLLPPGSDRGVAS